MSRAWLGYDNKPRKIKKVYIGKNNIAHEVVSGYVGINGVARKIYPTVDIPTVSGQGSFPYDTQEKELSLSDVDELSVNVTGTTKATNAGSYEVRCSLKDEHAVWEDGTTADKVTPWSITKVTGLVEVDQTYYYYPDYVSPFSFTPRTYAGNTQIYGAFQYSVNDNIGLIVTRNGDTINVELDFASTEGTSTITVYLSDEGNFTADSVIITIVQGRG